MKNSPLFRFGFNPYVPVMVPDDSVRNRQSKASPGLLGGKIWIEYLPEEILRNAGAAVGN